MPADANARASRVKNPLSSRVAPPPCTRTVQLLAGSMGVITVPERRRPSRLLNEVSCTTGSSVTPTVFQTSDWECSDCFFVEPLHVDSLSCSSTGSRLSRIVPWTCVYRVARLRRLTGGRDCGRRCNASKSRAMNVGTATVSDAGAMRFAGCEMASAGCLFAPRAPVSAARCRHQPLASSSHRSGRYSQLPTRKKSCQ